MSIFSDSFRILDTQANAVFFFFIANDFFRFRVTIKYILEDDAAQVQESKCKFIHAGFDPEWRHYSYITWSFVITKKNDHVF